jgi:hypothetical protein
VVLTGIVAISQSTTLRLGRGFSIVFFDAIVSQGLSTILAWNGFFIHHLGDSARTLYGRRHLSNEVLDELQKSKYVSESGGQVLEALELLRYENGFVASAS